MYSAPFDLDAILNDELRWQAKKLEVTLFPKFDIDIAIQLQAFSVNALISWLYIITMHTQKAPIYTLSHSKVPKHNKFSITNMQENPVDFIWHRKGIDYNFCNNFANLGSFARVSVSVESIILW